MAANIINFKGIDVIDAPAGDFWFDNCRLLGKICFEIDDIGTVDFEAEGKFREFLWENSRDYSLMGKLNVYLKGILKQVYLAKAVNV